MLPSPSDSVMCSKVPRVLPIESRVLGVRQCIGRSWICTQNDENWKERADIGMFASTRSYVFFQKGVDDFALNWWDCCFNRKGLLIFDLGLCCLGEILIDSDKTLSCYGCCN